MVTEDSVLLMKHVYSLTFSEGDFSTSIVSILLVSSQVTWGWLPWLLGVVTMVTAGIFAMVTAHCYYHGYCWYFYHGYCWYLYHGYCWYLYHCYCYYHGNSVTYTMVTIVTPVSLINIASLPIRRSDPSSSYHDYQGCHCLP